MYYLPKEKRFLRTKIVATIGEEKSDKYDLQGRPHPEEITYNMLFDWFKQPNYNHLMIDIIRLNMSFYETEKEEQYKKLFGVLADNNQTYSKNIAVLGDLPGPKIRLGNVQETELEIKKDKPVKLNFGEEKPSHISVLINDKPFIEMVKKVGECDTITEFIRNRLNENKDVKISLGDGDIILDVTNFSDNIATCTIEHIVEKGTIRNKMGFTLVGVNLEVGSFFDHDKQALDFLLNVKENPGEDVRVDFLGYIGVSFVKDANDILNVKYYVEKIILNKIKNHIKDKNFEEIKEYLIYKKITKNDLENPGKMENLLKTEARLRAPLIIGKIETRDGWDKIDEILDVADGLMVARGDLALQMSPQDVPYIQKEIIRKCNLRGKPVITATEMLSSMENKPNPTRAEATDVFNAILDGTTAVMLSGETSKGKYPANAVKMMVDIVKEAEGYNKKIHHDEKTRKNFNRHRYQEISSGSESLIQPNADRYSIARNDALTQNNRFGLFVTHFDEHIDQNAEKEIWFSWLREFFDDQIVKNSKQQKIDSISESACMISEEKKYCAIIVSSLTGRTAKMIGRFHPDRKIIPAVHHSISYRKMILSYGSYPININEPSENLDELVNRTIEVAKTEKHVRPGQEIVYVAGSPLWTIGEANLIQLQKIK
jgi:pyruvate kinase